MLSTAYPNSEFIVANTFAKRKKLEPNDINFSQGFSQKVVILENNNPILAFFINIISQPIQHLNISSAFIVYTITEMHMVLYNTIDVYPA